MIFISDYHGWYEKVKKEMIKKIDMLYIYFLEREGKINNIKN